MTKRKAETSPNSPMIPLFDAPPKNVTQNPLKRQAQESVPTNKSKFRTVRRLVRVLWQNDAPVTQNTTCEGKFHIYKITKNGYCEDKQCKDGGLPKNMQTLMPDYKFREAKALAAGSIREKADHCTRSHFLPFKNRDGKLYSSVVQKNGNLGGFTLSKENPLFLAVILKEGKSNAQLNAQLNAHALLYLKQPSLSNHSGALKTHEFRRIQKKSKIPDKPPRHLHIEYFCARGTAPGSGGCLMRHLLRYEIWEPLLRDFNDVERVTKQPGRRNVSKLQQGFSIGLMDDSGIVKAGASYYARFGFYPPEAGDGSQRYPEVLSPKNNTNSKEA